MKTCNGCIHQMEDKRPGIRAAKYNHVYFHDVKSICDECYLWINHNATRKNYEFFKYSKQKTKKYIDNLFEGI